MQLHALLSFAPLLAMLGVAAAIDLRSRRIPNWLTLMIAMTGTMQAFLSAATVTPLQSILGLLVGGLLSFALFAIGGRGGGDVKLLAAAGAWTGVTLIFYVFVVAALFEMVLALAQCAAQGRLRTLFRNTAVLAVNIAHAKELGEAHLDAAGIASSSAGRPLPYAVSVLAAMLVLLVRGTGVA